MSRAGSGTCTGADSNGYYAPSCSTSFFSIFGGGGTDVARGLNNAKGRCSEDSECTVREEKLHVHHILELVTQTL